VKFVILSGAKDLRLRILRFFAVFAAQNDGFTPKGSLRLCVSVVNRTVW